MKNIGVSLNAVFFTWVKSKHLISGKQFSQLICFDSKWEKIELHHITVLNKEFINIFPDQLY